MAACEHVHTHNLRFEEFDCDPGFCVDVRPVDPLGQQIFGEILRVASGARTKSEELGLGDNEFVPWQLGIVT